MDEKNDIELGPGVQIGDKNKRKNCCSLYWRYFTIITLTGSFFVVELVFGIIVGSLALQADAFHMLSDLLAQIIAFLSFRATMKPYSERATFGYKRADVIGGLINGVFLMSSCFFITLEAIHRFIELDELAEDFGNVDHLLIVAGIGLAINIFAAIIFSCGNKSNSGHNHSHGHAHGHSEVLDEEEDIEEIKSNQDMNIRALLLHILGDILGSIGVIDYGPFAFIDNFNPDFVPNTTDKKGRYRFDNQSGVCKWNLKKLFNSYTWRKEIYGYVSRLMGIMVKFV